MSKKPPKSGVGKNDGSGNTGPKDDFSLPPGGTHPDDPIITEDDLNNPDLIDPALARYIRSSAARELAAFTAARTDPTTGVRNPRAAAEEMHAAYKMRDKGKLKHISAVLIDLKDLGIMNKKPLEHLVGDAAITSTTEFFKKNLRKDDFFARIGGDEFLALMYCPEKDAQKRMGALKKKFKKEATAAFVAKLQEQYGEEGVGEKLRLLRQAYATKYGNPSLEEKPVSLNFSFGVKNITDDAPQFAPLDTAETIEQVKVLCDPVMQVDKDRDNAELLAYEGPYTGKNPPGTRPGRRRGAA